jgi:hypothetical protein
MLDGAAFKQLVRGAMQGIPAGQGGLAEAGL